MQVLFWERCDNCKNDEERAFTDTWTGTKLCLQCLSDVAPYVTNSPASEGDNLKDELRKRTANV